MDHGSVRPRRKRWPIHPFQQVLRVKIEPEVGLNVIYFGFCHQVYLALVVWCWSRLRLARLFQGAPVLWESNNYSWVAWKYKGRFSGVQEMFLFFDTLPHVKELYLGEAVHTWQRPIFELRFEIRSTWPTWTTDITTIGVSTGRKFSAIDV